MSDPIVLVSESAVQRRGGVAELLERFPARVVEASFGDRALDVVRTLPVSLIVFDLDQGVDPAFDDCRRMRSLTRAPIIAVSRATHSSAAIAALDAGADDFVSKPFGGEEFIARIRAHLRRGDGIDGDSIVAADGLTIDLARRRISRDGIGIQLTPIEWVILRTLVGRRGVPVSHDEIMRAVWNRSSGRKRTEIRVYITSLRRKLERQRSDPFVIVTEPGFGYRFATRDAAPPRP